ncbi:ABC transporter substrate-binding protein [Methylobacillus caricis]|uniref:ABC transporter substrate-binding protein n=1 Tax=Methylobacillus caricis TaxID=1971611 RepID=UPI001CFF7502|nr:ABC transporter substrate-binding protein [Methylobacillus caricis]MCB5187481.1 ABC transporter substrate-binding protein [Methylobacillus caricis]
MKRKTVLILALTAALVSITTQAAQEQHFSIAGYRIGPYAAGGSGQASGLEDYLQLINLRDGGVNGVKLSWTECETEYIVERGVECYERTKKNATTFNPFSVGIAYGVIDRATADKIPVITPNHGRTDSTDGRVFPYIFPVILNPWSEASAIINYLAQRAGGPDKLKGKKIVTLYHGSPYGKETIPIFALLAKQYGFENIQIEVPHPGNEQQSQWLNIRRIKPDWVILRGWGVMNPVALKTAQKTGFPTDRIIGNVWSNSEEDAEPAGQAAKGYISATTHPSGSHFPVLQDIKRHVYGANKGKIEPQRVGSIYYNMGVLDGILHVEAVRVAQKKFGQRALTGDELRWGWEHIAIDDKRLDELGASGLLQPIKLTCDDHEGGGAVKFQQWDGKQWKVISDWIQADRKLLRPLIEASAEKYAKEKNIKPRDCSKE